MVGDVILGRLFQNSYIGSMKLLLIGSIIFTSFIGFSQIKTSPIYQNPNDPFKLPTREVNYGTKSESPFKQQGLTPIDSKYLNSISQASSAPGLVVSLSIFDASDDELQYFNDSLHLFTSLEFLFIIDDKLPELPKSLGSLPKLKAINISSGDLSKLPESLKNSSTLQKIAIAGEIQADDFPDWFVEVKQLESLSLINCGLSEIPESIFKMRNLKSLDLSRNELTTIPSSLGAMQNLEDLDLAHNQLNSLAEEVYQLQKLKRINLTGNKLSTLSEDMKALSALEELNLYENSIQEFPSSIFEMSALRSVFVSEDISQTAKKQAKKINRKTDITIYYAANKYSLPKEYRNKYNRSNYGDEFNRGIQQRQHDRWIQQTMSGSHPSGM